MGDHSALLLGLLGVEGGRGAPSPISEIVLGKRAISADTALRLAPFLRDQRRFLVGSALQLKRTRREIGERLDGEIRCGTNAPGFAPDPVAR